MHMILMELERLVPKVTRLIIIFDPKSLALPYRPLYGRHARVIMELKDFPSYSISPVFANGDAASTRSPQINAGQCTVVALWVVDVRVYVNLIRAAHLPVELAYQGLYVPVPPVARGVALHEATCGLRRFGVESRWDQ